MNVDRNAVRSHREKISLNSYDKERLESLLNQMGGERAKLAYEAFIRGLDLLEEEARKPGDDIAA